MIDLQTALLVTGVLIILFTLAAWAIVRSL